MSTRVGNTFDLNPPASESSGILNPFDLIKSFFKAWDGDSQDSGDVQGSGISFSGSRQNKNMNQMSFDSSIPTQEEGLPVKMEPALMRLPESSPLRLPSPMDMGDIAPMQLTLPQRAIQEVVQNPYQNLPRAQDSIHISPKGRITLLLPTGPRQIGGSDI